MNRIILLTITALILSGCGSSSDDENEIPSWCLQQYSTDTTWVDDTGDTDLVLEPSSNMYVTPQEVNLFYQEVRACAAQTYPEIADAIGPSVRYESFGGTGYMGSYTTYLYPTALVNTDDPIGRRSCYSDKWTLKHEFLHHLIFVGGLPLSPYPDGHPSAGYPNPHATKLFALEADGGCMPVLIVPALTN